MKLHFLGGAKEIGGSAILVELNDYKVLLDCGIRQSAGKDPLPDFRKIQELGGVDAVIISHAHMDHTGTLPLISKEYPLASIYATVMTIDLTRVLLYDSIKLMNRKEEGIPVYAAAHVEALFTRMRGCRYEETLEILPGLKLTMYPAGHIAGAACIFLESKEGSLFYTGDFSGFSQNTIEGIRIPKLRPDVIITEATYGDKLHANRQVEEKALVEVVRECIEKKGKMVIPAFALGRAQEVLLILRRAMNKGELPKVKIYVDGMVRDMNMVYSRHPWYLKNALAKRIEKGNDIFYSDEIVPVGMKDDRMELLNGNDATIFVASSGMLTGGPSAMYAEKIAPMENGYIIITGYQDEEAPGRQIQQLLESEEEERFLTVNEHRVPVRCTLRKISLSAHGDKAEIQGLLERLSARHIFLVHGDPAVVEGLASELDVDYRTRIYTPETGDSETISLRSPRKQLKRMYQYTMQRRENFWEKESYSKELYEYIQTYYTGNKFTVNDMAFIWYGKNITEEDILIPFEQMLNESVYFSRDGRRLFLFQCSTREEMDEILKKSSGMDQNSVMKYAEEIFAAYSYKKISCFTERKELQIVFDFPKSAGAEFDTLADDFLEETGWKIYKNSEPNEYAIQTFLSERLGTNLQKISIRKQECSVMLSFYQPVDDKELETLCQEFESLTGYSLLYKGKSYAGNHNKQATERIPENQNDVYPENQSEPVEQNLAFSCFDAEFEGEQILPCKKGIQSDAQGKYLQIAFLSPQLGIKMKDTLQRIADQTGWRIRIADSVNQNMVLAYASQICKEHQVLLRKNPSYLPEKQELLLKPADGLEISEEVRILIEKEILEKTGLVSKWELRNT
ncbi:MAG: MBL fold metallo-hydrolase [Oliverpabstia sp.]